MRLELGYAPLTAGLGQSRITAMIDRLRRLGLALVLASPALAYTTEAPVTVYIGTYTDGTSRGIYRTSLDPGGTWYFVSGREVKPGPVVRESPKIGSNDPCPCGSGRKHKKCCGAA